MKLSPAELETYNESGFLVRRQVFLEEEVAAFRAAADVAAQTAKVMAESADARRYVLDGNLFADIGCTTVQFEHHHDAAEIRVIEPVHELHDQFTQLVHDPRLVRPMRQLVDSAEVALWTAKLNMKSSRVGSGFAWHQDTPYWVHDCDEAERLPNVMVNFDDSSVSNGCLHIVKGSHKLGMLPGCRDPRQLAGFYTDPAAFDASDQMPIEVPSGSVVFFHPLAVHGSMPNDSAWPRRGIILTYQPANRPTLKRRDIVNALG
jgi:ectoine hydroxylase-related dioxygenase (phytanoyl-CoA dioxygenase family)